MCAPSYHTCRFISVTSAKKDLLVYDGHTGVVNRRRGSLSAFLRARR
jgi:hypothetical protein